MKTKRYDITQCALYRCQSRRRLCEILFLSRSQLKDLANTATHYRRKEQLKKDGSVRILHAPSAPLKRAQKRISELLMRLEPPSYLMCPVRGRSNIENAALHRGAKAFRFLDLASFFPSCKSAKIYNFFKTQLKCSEDVSFELTRLTTLEGSLPQGSPSSPILAFWAYRDMWDELSQAVEHAGCRMTVWVDDITLSGMKVPNQYAYKLKKIIESHGLSIATAKEGSSIDRPVTVTGVVIKGHRLLLPNRLHKARFDFKREAYRLKSGPQGERFLRSIAGLDQFESQILKKSIS